MSKRAKQTRIVPRRMKWVKSPGMITPYFGEFGSIFYMDNDPAHPYAFCANWGGRYRAATLPACKRLARKVVIEWLNEAARIEEVGDRDSCSPQPPLKSIGDKQLFSAGWCRLTEISGRIDEGCSKCELELLGPECDQGFGACHPCGNKQHVHAYWKLCSEKGE